MNDNIKRLLVQCGAIGHDDDGNEYAPVLVGSNLEKFSELIVKEAIDECRKEWYELNNDETVLEDKRLIGIRIGKKGGVIRCINRIATHFGYDK